MMGSTRLLLTKRGPMLTTDQWKAKLLARSFFRDMAQAYAASVFPHRYPTIAGYGIGSRKTAGDPKHVEDVVVIFVHEKTAALKSIPPLIGDLPTQIIEVGEVRPLAMTDDDPTKRHRPAPGGVSIGHPDVTAGTLGCVVEKEDTWFILGNNHVLANTNRAKLGDRIIQAATSDEGHSPQDDIATLAEFSPLVFDQSNSMDAAIARVDHRADVSPKILRIGQLSPTPCDPEIGQPVCKYGRTSRYTEGIVTAIHSDIAVTYRIGDQDIPVWFDDQRVIENSQGGYFSRPGDSGSLIVMKDTAQPVGLLFASSDSHHKLTLANPITSVFTRFQVRLVV